MIECVTCGAANPDGSVFCNACGSQLEPSTERETRKTVTVVFCDVAGSTSMGEQLDPETLRRLMTRYFEASRRALEHHGGTVEKFIGDAVMAVFGIPVVHEDDALRGVRAATDLRAGVAGRMAAAADPWPEAATIVTAGSTDAASRKVLALLEALA